MMPLVRQEGEIIDLILKIFDVHEICKRFKVPMMNERLRGGICRNLPFLST